MRVVTSSYNFHLVAYSRVVVFLVFFLAMHLNLTPCFTILSSSPFILVFSCFYPTLFYVCWYQLASNLE